MEADKLQIYEKPCLREPRLILGFSGWMNGGEVSSGTVQGLINKLEAKYFAEIEPEGFYIMRHGACGVRPDMPKGSCRVNMRNISKQVTTPETLPD